DGKRCLSALLVLPLQLRHLRAVRERLAVSRHAFLEGFDDGRIADDHFEDVVGTRGRNDRPVLVALEVGEGDAARRLQRVLVLRISDRGAERSSYGGGDRDRELAAAVHNRSSASGSFGRDLTQSTVRLGEKCGGEE